ncbi:MAG: mevalonate kinase [Nitrososphaeria archaeon]|nr:mevalonate kinase [Nitrososphaeria archaeon]
MRAATASAPGKIILFGEHFVVHGNPAIASAINLRASVEVVEAEGGVISLEGFIGDNPASSAASYLVKKLGYNRGLRLRISSQIPQSVGLGSSAAIAVASAAATLQLIGRKLDHRLLLEAAHEGEKVAHYTPSGIDTSIAVFGGAGVYTRSEGYKKIDMGLEELLVINTGRPRRTGDLVRKVREFGENNPGKFGEILDEAARIVDEALRALREPDLEIIGRLMNRNQELLRMVGVSSEEIEEVIGECLRLGACGAKLTGAGGGGCVIAVADRDQMDKISRKLCERCQVMRVGLMAEGVRIEPRPGSP